MRVGQRSVLIVDDEPHVCQLVEGILTGEGFRCESALSVELAKRRLLEAKFDLVLLDVVIPGSDGLKVLDLIVRRHLAARVICMTGLATAGWEERALSAGAAAVLRKPFDVETIIRAIDRVLAVGTPPT